METTIVDECTNRIETTRAEHIEMMAGAYLKATDIPIQEVELVEEHDGLMMRWYFRRRKDMKP
jgi:uncharacterized HAD superfamily protein